MPALIVLVVQDRYRGAVHGAVGRLRGDDRQFPAPLAGPGRAQIDALTVFIGVLGGVSAFGPIGVILGPLVLALAIALVRFSR